MFSSLECENSPSLRFEFDKHKHESLVFSQEIALAREKEFKDASGEGLFCYL